MSLTERIGIYGGTFDPPHLGHFRAACAFYDSCALDTLYILPTAVPPHKVITRQDNPADRLAMCRLAFENGRMENRRVIVSDYEQTRGGKSYTILTLEHFRTLSDTIYLLCGTDMFLTLDTWYRGTDILKTAKICCLARETDSAAANAIDEKAADYRERFGTEIIRPAFTPLVVSSTDIRRRIREKQQTDGLLSPAVRTYIETHRLYTE